MPPRTSTDSQTSNYHSLLRRDDKDGKQDSRPSAATYYGAVVIVVFIVIALSITSRILYVRRLRRRSRQPDDADPAVGEQEERMAMQRRGEEGGLPTYRESTAMPNEDTVLAATPMTDTLFARGSTVDTLPHSENATVEHAVSIPSDDQDQPPKYESNHGDGPVAHQTLHPMTLDITNEMRMSTQSTATLFLPSIQVHDPEENDLPSNEPNPRHQPSPTSSPSSPPPPSPPPQSSQPPPPTV